MKWWDTSPTIPLGTSRFLLFGRRTLRITPQQARAHMHVLGKTGSGKSYFLAGLFLAMHQAGMPATLIDPHGDLAELVLSHLVQRGTFTDPAAYDRLVYLDLPAAASTGRFLPFNFLQQPYDDHAMAELVAEACRRAWPELATGAPTFENILKHSVIALRQNRLPLTELANLLTDRPFREQLLLSVTDPQVVRFFHLRMDQWGRDEAHMKESTLNRADLLTLSPVLRHSLGARENRLSFRQLIDSGRSLIVNLAIPDADARRLFGCLLTVGMESAALSRADNLHERTPHHLIIDEFSQFMAQSETALTRMLSESDCSGGRPRVLIGCPCSGCEGSVRDRAVLRAAGGAGGGSGADDRAAAGADRRAGRAAGRAGRADRGAGAVAGRLRYWHINTYSTSTSAFASRRDRGVTDLTSSRCGRPRDRRRGHPVAC